MPVTILRSAGASELLKTAVQKFTVHDRNFDSTGVWSLHYPDGSEVCGLPEGGKPFQS